MVASRHDERAVQATALGRDAWERMPTRGLERNCGLLPAVRVYSKSLLESTARLATSITHLFGRSSSNHGYESGEGAEFGGTRRTVADARLYSTLGGRRS